jgi:hypothetical protein
MRGPLEACFFAGQRGTERDDEGSKVWVGQGEIEVPAVGARCLGRCGNEPWEQCLVGRAACSVRTVGASERADTGRSKARPCVGGAGAGLGFGFRAGALAVSTIFLRRARRRWKIRQDRKGCQALAVAAQRQHKTGDGVTADVGLCLLSVGDGCAVCSRRYE